MKRGLSFSASRALYICIDASYSQRKMNIMMFFRDDVKLGFCYEKVIRSVCVVGRNVVRYLLPYASRRGAGH